MTIETCPNCGKELDAQKHRYTGGVLSYFRPRWPGELIDHQFTVRCPNCGVAYVSDSVKFLGIATRKTYLVFGFVLVLIVVLLDKLFP